MDFWNELTYKSKNYILLVGFGLLLLIVYWMNISETIALSNENQKLKTELEKAEDAPDKIIGYQVELKKLNKRLENYMIDPVLDQEYLLEVVSAYCENNGLYLRELPLIVEDHYGDYIISTSIVEAEGDFVKLLKLMYALECKHQVGRLSSAEYELKKDRQTRKMVLTLKMYLQKINEL